MKSNEDGLYDKQRIGCTLIALLETAKNAGMPQERAEAIYEDVRAYYRQMRDGFASELVKELLVFLTMTDEQYAEIKRRSPGLP